MKTVQQSLLPLLSLLLGSTFCNGAKDNPLPNVENDVLRISLSRDDASLIVVDKRITLEWRQQVRSGFRVAPDSIRVSPTSLSATVLGEGATYVLTVSLTKESPYAFDLVLDIPDRHYATMPGYPFPFVAPEKGWYYVQNTSGEGMLMPLEKAEDIHKEFSWSDVIAKLLSGEIRTNGNPFADFEKLCDEGNDIVEDVIGVLWEFPLAFQRIVTWRDRVGSLDILSGRIYGERAATNPARIAFRKLIASKEAAPRAPVDKVVDTVFQRGPDRLICSPGIG